MLAIGAFIVGLLVGWNFFPQPAVVKGWMDKLRGKTPTIPEVIIPPPPPRP